MNRPSAVVKNVGVIFYSQILTPGLAAELRKKLEGLHRSKAVVRVLHHGGGCGPDETALLIARDLGGWLDRAHPGGDTAIAGASTILIAAGPRPGRNADPSPWAARWLNTIQHARATRVHIVYLDETEQPRRPGKPRSTPAKEPEQAAARRASPAPRVSKQSRAAAKPARAQLTCRRCKMPVSASGERWGWLCESCERRPRVLYLSPRDPRVRVPPSKSVRAVPAGLPGLGKRR